MLVVSDLDDIFLPKPTDLLVNLTESRAGLEALLARLPDMFQESHAIGSALGPALQAAYKMTVSALHNCREGYVVMLCGIPGRSWVQDHRADSKPADAWCRCAEESRGPEDSGDEQGT